MYYDQQMTGIDEGFAQIPEESAPPFGAGIGFEAQAGPVGGGAGGHIDSTPMTLGTFMIVLLIVLLLLHYADLRFHVTI